MSALRDKVNEAVKDRVRRVSNDADRRRAERLIKEKIDATFELRRR